MDQASIRKIADHLARRPIGRIVTVVPTSADDYIIAIEDRRDGREHVMEDVQDFELWLDSFKQGRLGQLTKAFCDCCCKVHTDKDLDGELFELCLGCQAELTASAFEQTS